MALEINGLADREQCRLIGVANKMWGIGRVVGVIAFCIAFGLTAEAAERTIVGYTSPMTVRPGDIVEFKISSEKGPASYQADLVKVINGDSITRYGDKFEMRASECCNAAKVAGVNDRYGP